MACWGLGEGSTRKLVSPMRDCGSKVVDSQLGSISEMPSALVVAPISFVCPCGRGADYVRSLALWTRPKGEVLGVAFAPVSEAQA